MKKLILLLFIPLVFSCSDESSDSDNNSNNSSNKKLISVVSESQFTNDEVYLYYTNDKLTMMEYFYDGDNDEGYTEIFEHLDGEIRITSTNSNDETQIRTYPVNQDGTINSPYLIFENGYLISFIVTADGGAEPSTTNYIWQNGNLVSEIIYYENSEEQNGYMSFSDYDNVFGFFPNAWRYPDFLAETILGIWGNASANLPLEGTYNDPETLETEVTTFSYLFDDEGYPIRIIAIMDGYPTTYNLTYSD